MMEGCSGSYHWARLLIGLGFEVKLIPPHYVTPYRRRNKTDRADCEAILEADRCAGIHGITVKSEAQQAIMALHRVRSQVDGHPYRPHQRHARDASGTRRCLRPGPIVRLRRARDTACFAHPPVRDSAPQSHENSPVTLQDSLTPTRHYLGSSFATAV
jgi:hypothetical protein